VRGEKGVSPAGRRVVSDSPAGESVTRVSTLCDEFTVHGSLSFILDVQRISFLPLGSAFTFLLNSFYCPPRTLPPGMSASSAPQQPTQPPLLPTLSALLPLASLASTTSTISLLSIHSEPYTHHDVVYLNTQPVLPGQHRFLRLRASGSKGGSKPPSSSSSSSALSLAYLSARLREYEDDDVSVKAIVEVDLAGQSGKDDVQDFVKTLGFV
jgi:hypothetical protein